MSYRIPLFFRNLFFTILQPGIVAGLVPYLIVTVDDFVFIRAQFSSAILISSLVIFVVGLVVMILCVIRFGTHGKGTISPVDPTKVLVISGLYKYSRNPMYLGVLLMLIGECMFTSNRHLWSYTVGFFIVVNLFIIYREEPRLRRDFGDAYLRYCRNVRRWI